MSLLELKNTLARKSSMVISNMCHVIVSCDWRYFTGRRNADTTEERIPSYAR